MKLLSVVVPCYNEEENISYFYEEFIKNKEFFDQEDLDYEIIYIDDGSRDRTVEEIRKLHELDAKVKMISFSRNFGKEAGLLAGLEAAKGDYVVAMDVDLQDPPSLLPEMFSYLKEGYDSVATRRVNRKGEPVIRSFFARRFYSLMKKISKTEIVDGARDYRLMTRQMVDAILSMPEYNRFTKGIYGWVGFKTKWIEFKNIERMKGETKWSFWKLLLYSMEGVIAFSTVPLSIATIIGFLVCVLSFLGILFVVIRTMVWGDPNGGWPSMICILGFLSGVQMFCLGIIGQYLAKTYMEVKKRPIYIVKDTI